MQKPLRSRSGLVLDWALFGKIRSEITWFSKVQPLVFACSNAGAVFL